MASFNFTVSYNGSSVSTFTDSSANVTYNGSTIVSISAEGTKTLKCNGKVMLSDIVIGSKTLKCNGKLMASDVVITAVSAIQTYTITPTLTNVTAVEGNPTTIDTGEEKTLSFFSDEGYTLPTTVEVQGATVKSWTVVTQYLVNLTAENCAINGVSSYSDYISTDETATLSITADGTSYAVPETLSIPGGTYTRTNNSSATLTISGLTEDVTATISAVTTLPAPSNVTADGTTISFDAVDGATSYEIYADGVSIGTYTP